jgi:hypothetical protein
MEAVHYYLLPAGLDVLVLRRAGQPGPPLRRPGRGPGSGRHHEPCPPVGRGREPRASLGRLRARAGAAPVRRGHEPRAAVRRPQYPPLRRGSAAAGAELHDTGGGLGPVAALAHELLDLRLGQAHLEPDGPAAALGACDGERRGRRGGGRGGREGEVGGGAAREHKRLQPLPRADVEGAGPGAARRDGGPRQRDEEVEPARAERRGVRQRPRAHAVQLYLLRLEQLEPRVVAQHRARERRRLHAERRAVQLRHLGALAPSADAVAHCRTLSPTADGFGARLEFLLVFASAASPAFLCREVRDGLGSAARVVVCGGV